MYGSQCPVLPSGIVSNKDLEENQGSTSKSRSSLLLQVHSSKIQRRDIPITTIPIPPNKTKPLKPPAPPNHPLFLPNANKRRSLQKSPPVTRPPPRPAVPMIMMEQPPHVPGGGLLGSSIRHVRAQLRGQNRNVRASAFVFDEDRLEVVELVLADLGVCG